MLDPLSKHLDPAEVVEVHDQLYLKVWILRLGLLPILLEEVDLSLQQGFQDRFLRYVGQLDLLYRSLFFRRSILLALPRLPLSSLVVLYYRRHYLLFLLWQSSLFQKTKETQAQILVLRSGCVT